MKIDIMYSKKISEILKKNNLDVGKRIRIEKPGQSYEGLIMPSSDSDQGSVIIKLDNGYNIGIKIDEKTKVEKSTGKEPRKVADEEKLEMGKVNKNLLKIKFDPEKPKISFIATGGTVASRIDYKTGGVAALEDPREFLHNIPELAEIVYIEKLLKPFTKMSEDMGHEDWIEIAKLTVKELNSSARGIIITHGTDTLHYTSAALSFFLKNLSKPVVLLGSQRSPDRGSSDAGQNLICAAHAAISDIAEVGTCMHGTINDDHCLFIRGTHSRKMDSERRDAFRPINEYPLAKVWPDGKIEIKNRNHKKRNDSGHVELDTKFEPKVAIVKTYPDSDPSVIDFYVSKGYKGFVIESTGLGHVPTNGKKEWITTIKKHTKDGIPFVTTPQTIYGRLNPNVYSNLRILYKEAGAIPGQDMLTEAAFVKLGWVLGHTNDPQEVKDMMLTNYAGEITKRTLVGSFLY